MQVRPDNVVNLFADVYKRTRKGLGTEDKWCFERPNRLLKGQGHEIRIG